MSQLPYSTPSLYVAAVPTGVSIQAKSVCAPRGDQLADTLIRVERSLGRLNLATTCSGMQSIGAALRMLLCI